MYISLVSVCASLLFSFSYLHRIHLFGDDDDFGLKWEKNNCTTFSSLSAQLCFVRSISNSEHICNVKYRLSLLLCVCVYFWNFKSTRSIICYSYANRFYVWQQNVLFIFFFFFVDWILRHILHWFFLLRIPIPSISRPVKNNVLKKSMKLKRILNMSRTKKKIKRFIKIWRKKVETDVALK